MEVSTVSHETAPVMPLAILNIRLGFSSLTASRFDPGPLKGRLVDLEIATVEDDIATFEDDYGAWQPGPATSKIKFRRASMIQSSDAASHRCSMGCEALVARSKEGQTSRAMMCWRHR